MSAEQSAEIGGVPARPWPDAVLPTAQEWLDWFLTCPRAEQERQVANLMEQSDQAWRCFVQRHEDELRVLRDRVARLVTSPAVVCPHDPVCRRFDNGWPACATSPGSTEAGEQA